MSQAVADEKVSARKFVRHYLLSVNRTADFAEIKEAWAKKGDGAKLDPSILTKATKDIEARYGVKLADLKRKPSGAVVLTALLEGFLNLNPEADKKAAMAALEQDGLTCSDYTFIEARRRHKGEGSYYQASKGSVDSKKQAKKKAGTKVEPQPQPEPEAEIEEADDANAPLQKEGPRARFLSKFGRRPGTSNPPRRPTPNRSDAKDAIKEALEDIEQQLDSLVMLAEEEILSVSTDLRVFRRQTGAMIVKLEADK